MESFFRVGSSCERSCQLQNAKGGAKLLEGPNQALSYDLVSSYHLCCDSRSSYSSLIFS